jgi:hypothetical protein
LAKGRKARGCERIADARPILLVELVEIDCETLPEVSPALDRQKCPTMRPVAAAPEGVPLRACERRSEHDGRPAIDRNALAGERQQRRGYAARGFDAHAMGDELRDVRTAGKGHVEPDDANGSRWQRYARRVGCHH